MNALRTVPGTTSRPKTVAPLWRWLVIAVEAPAGAAAVYGGIGLIADNAIQMKDAWLDGTPFDTWALPGIFLLVVVAAPMITAAAAEISRQVWAYRASLLAGAAQVCWIVAQWVIIGEYFFLQPVMLGVGVAVIALARLAHRHEAR